MFWLWTQSGEPLVSMEGLERYQGVQVFQIRNCLTAGSSTPSACTCSVEVSLRTLAQQQKLKGSVLWRWMSNQSSNSWATKTEYGKIDIFWWGGHWRITSLLLERWQTSYDLTRWYPSGVKTNSLKISVQLLIKRQTEVWCFIGSFHF